MSSDLIHKYYVYADTSIYMDIYQEIVDLLGLNSDPDSLEDLEDELLDELGELNETYRSLDTQIKKTKRKLEELRQEVAEHNERAIELIKKGDESMARRELETKEQLLSKIQSEESALTDLRRNIQRVESRRSDLEEKLQEIRERKNRRGR